MEIALLRLLKKGLKNSYEIHRHPTIIQKMILQCRFDGSQQNWDAALRFPDQQTFDALTFVFNQLGKSQTMEIESSESLIAKEGTLDLQSYRTLSLADFHVKFAVRPPDLQTELFANCRSKVLQKIFPVNRRSRS